MIITKGRKRRFDYDLNQPSHTTTSSHLLSLPSQQSSSHSSSSSSHDHEKDDDDMVDSEKDEMVDGETEKEKEMVVTCHEIVDGENELISSLQPSSQHYNYDEMVGDETDEMVDEIKSEISLSSSTNQPSSTTISHEKYQTKEDNSYSSLPISHFNLSAHLLSFLSLSTNNHHDQPPSPFIFSISNLSSPSTNNLPPSHFHHNLSHNLPPCHQSQQNTVGREGDWRVDVYWVDYHHQAIFRNSLFSPSHNNQPSSSHDQPSHNNQPSSSHDQPPPSSHDEERGRERRSSEMVERALSSHSYIVSLVPLSPMTWLSIPTIYQLSSHLLSSYNNEIRNLPIDLSRFNLSDLDFHKNKQQQQNDKNIFLTSSSHKEDEDEEEMDYTISTNHSINSTTTTSHSILSLSSSHLPSSSSTSSNNCWVNLFNKYLTYLSSSSSSKNKNHFSHFEKLSLCLCCLNEKSLRGFYKRKEEDMVTM